MLPSVVIVCVVCLLTLNGAEEWDDFMHGTEDNIVAKIVEQHRPNIKGHKSNHTGKGLTIFASKYSAEDDLCGGVDDELIGFDELLAHRESYGDDYLNHHVINQQLSLQQMAKLGRVETASGASVLCRVYDDPVHGPSYTVNGIRCKESNVKPGLKVTIITTDGPLWCPVANTTSDLKKTQPLVALLLDIFDDNCDDSLTQDALLQFIKQFANLTKIKDDPYTVCKPSDDVVQAWCALITISPDVVTNQLPFYIFPGIWGQADLDNFDHLNNILNESVLINHFDDDTLKIGNCLADYHHPHLLADGKGFYYEAPEDDNLRAMSLPQQAPPHSPPVHQPFPQQPFIHQALPQQALPQQVMPQQALPQQALPQQALPQQQPSFMPPVPASFGRFFG